jgi:DNA-binding transcriptional ArsR family regulator
VPVAPESGLDPALLDPTRFSIVSLLVATRWADFGFVRDAVGLSDSALSKQITTLARLTYVEVEKGYVGKRPRTWLRLSPAGREALGRHVAGLNEIARRSAELVEGYEVTDGPPGFGSDPDPDDRPAPERGRAGRRP